MFCSTATPRTLPKLSSTFGTSAASVVHVRVQRRELSLYESEYTVQFFTTEWCTGLPIRTETFQEFGECRLLESLPLAPQSTAPTTGSSTHGWFGGMPYVGLYRDCPQCGAAGPLPPTGDFVTDAECQLSDPYVRTIPALRLRLRAHIPATVPVLRPRARQHWR